MRACESSCNPVQVIAPVICGHSAGTETVTKRKIDDPWQAQGKLTDSLVAALTPPPATGKGNRIRWDGEAGVPGFGARITSSGGRDSRSFVLRYRNRGGRDRILTIGSFPEWSVNRAREQALSLKRRIADGRDPLGERQELRDAPTVNDLVDRFETEHVAKKRPGTAAGYRANLRVHVRPVIGRLKVADVSYRDIERMHHRIAQTAPYAANRTLAVTSKMFALAVKWGLRPDNPCKGVERSEEHRRETFLSPAQIIKLGEVLNVHSERTSARAVQLLSLTGSRRSEVLGARWVEFDLEAGVWTKPHANTKSKRDHRLPLSAPALQVLAEMRAEADAEDARRASRGLAPLPFLFPGQGGKPLQNVKRFWASVCRQAGLRNVRLHDLRHTHASILASQGFSLPVIGALLGHSQPATTHRYSHLMDDPLRAAAERVAAIITGGKSSDEVVSLPCGQHGSSGHDR
jgi:integrase